MRSRRLHLEQETAHDKMQATSVLLLILGVGKEDELLYFVFET